MNAMSISEPLHCSAPKFGKALPTQAELHQRFTYDASTGNLHHIKGNGPVKRGGKAGRIDEEGYVIVSIKNRLYRAHRLVWIFHHGSIGSGLVIDHINCIRSDNRIENLRLVTVQINTQNRKKAHRNHKSTGIQGVYPRGKRFYSTIMVSGKNHPLGTYDTIEEAHQAYLRAKSQLHAGA